MPTTPVLPTTDLPPTDSSPARGSLLARDLAVVAVVGAVVANVVAVLVGGDASDTQGAARLAAIAAHPVEASVGHLAFLVGELATIGAALGIAHLVRPAAPRLGLVGAFLLVIGAAADGMAAASQLVAFAMAPDVAHRAADAALLSAVTALPGFRVVAVLGLLGTVAGSVVLGIAVFRSRVVPRWVPVLWWLFLLVEFVGSSLVGALSYVSVAMLAVVYVVLGRSMLRRW